MQTIVARLPGGRQRAEHERKLERCLRDEKYTMGHLLRVSAVSGEFQRQDVPPAATVNISLLATVGTASRVVFSAPQFFRPSVACAKTQGFFLPLKIPFVRGNNQPTANRGVNFIASDVDEGASVCGENGNEADLGRKLRGNRKRLTTCLKWKAGTLIPANNVIDGGRLCNLVQFKFRWRLVWQLGGCQQKWSVTVSR